ncbi:2-oxoglutarate and iron-dependent oxygenase domain-containing protein 2-like isoform X2 [Amphiura filiformis]|uniref:2-oxoglutarate and iron-dependent oxygenase domain-containing protein 2-like isoform X2 n=1 Tax=Amphiura filiformis TaxID=82378 RepID=UPI003B2107EC
MTQPHHQCPNQNFYVCQCFYTHNIFLQQYNLHVIFHDEKQFMKDWKGIKTELSRRRNLGSDCLDRCLRISEGYIPLHSHVYKLQESYLAAEFLDLVKYAQMSSATAEGLITKLSQENASRVFSFPVFTKTFCDEFMAEISHFENSDLPKGRPNTMNNYGILLNELGFDTDFITPLRLKYLTPLTSLLFPDWGGDYLDSHKAFVVKYKLGEDLDLAYHYDNAEVTINVSLGREFMEGTLYFGDMRQVPIKETECTEYSHKPTIGLLHRGQHKHGALPITSGERYNLIVWMRSSRIRNQLCPMCNNKPVLVKMVGYGDGFTEGSLVDVCTTL